jgi:hypothetical protein
MPPFQCAFQYGPHPHPFAHSLAHIGPNSSIPRRITALSMAHSMPLFDVRFVLRCPFCLDHYVCPHVSPFVPMPCLYQPFTYPAHVVARNIGQCESAPYRLALCTPYAVGIPLPLSTYVPHHVPIQPLPHTSTMYLPMYHYTTHHILTLAMYQRMYHYPLCTHLCTNTPHDTPIYPYPYPCAHMSLYHIHAHMANRRSMASSRADLPLVGPPYPPHAQ